MSLPRATTLGLLVLLGCAHEPAPAGRPPGGKADDGTPTLRIAQYNIRELTTAKLLDPGDEQVRLAAAIIAFHDADVVSLNEVQFDLADLPELGLPGAAEAVPGAVSADGATAGNAARLAARVAQLHPDVEYRHTALFLGNSGMPFDDPLGQPEFASRGFGEWPGRFNSAVLSRHEILYDQVRVIHDYPWHDLPGNLVADLEAELGLTVPAGFPIFEKGLHVVPIALDAGAVLHLVLLHPVSAGFSDLNPYRNADELHALALFLSGELPGVEPLPEGAHFVVLGDLNSDPEDGESPGSVSVVADHPAVTRHFPIGDGGTGGTHPERNTFLSGCGRGAGPIVVDPTTRLQLQLDYLLPSTPLGEPLASAIYWPHHQDEPDEYELACRASDHRYVWIDLARP